MLNGLQHRDSPRESYWSHNIMKLFELFINKGSPTKYCFQVFQYFFNEFIDCMDEPYIIAGLRALAAHHTLLLANDEPGHHASQDWSDDDEDEDDNDDTVPPLWYHTIKTQTNEQIELTWKMLFNEFRTNLHCYVRGRMYITFSNLCSCHVN